MNVSPATGFTTTPEEIFQIQAHADAEYSPRMKKLALIILIIACICVLGIIVWIVYKKIKDFSLFSQTAADDAAWWGILLPWWMEKA